MGFALTVLYLVATYLGTDTLFGPLVAYHIELIIAILVIVVSLPSLPGSFVLRTPQALALVGLALAVFLSVLATGWAGGAVTAFQAFIPNAFVYFFVCLHCNSGKRLKILVFLLLFACLFVIAHGLIELRAPLPQTASVESTSVEGDYLLGQKNDQGQWIFRLRGKGFINDPNDFAQLIVCLIPLLFVFWRPKRRFWNLFCVLAPVCALIFGAFLTHSRGFIIAFLAVAILAGRRRIGTLPSVITAGVMFFAASAMNFTGGRAVSLDAGSDRTNLWSGGLEALKSHPFFGVGFGRLPDFLGLTAHNSIVVCAAELGLFGLFFWSLFLFPTLRDAVTVASAKRSTGAAFFPPNILPGQRVGQGADLGEAEIPGFGRLTLLSLAGFLVAGFFLSRAFVMTLFLLAGMGEVAYEMAIRRGMVKERLRLGRAVPYAAGLAVAMVLFVYVMLRITNLVR